MSSETSHILNRLEQYFLPGDSPAQLELFKEPNLEEKGLIESIKKFKAPEDWAVETLSERLKSEEFKDELSQPDIETLAFLIKKFGECFKDKKGDPIFSFDEQILALVRAIKNHKDPKEKGLVLEMETGEGKSSVVIPLLVSYFLLMGERVTIHEINPYLLNENYQRFLDFARVLGIEKEVGLLADYQDKEGLMKNKKVVFGYWPIFVHYRQHQFLSKEREKKDEKPPVMILDEVDQILNEEATNPAIISQEMVDSESTLNDYREQLIKDSKSGREMGETREIKVQIGSRNYQLNVNPGDWLPKDAEGFKKYIKVFFQRLRGIYEKYNSKDYPLEERLNYLSQELSCFLFRDALFSQLQEQGVDLEKIPPETFTQLNTIFDQLDISFWWDNPGFQQNLITAFLLTDGVDYQVKEGRIIQPLSQTTGYPEESKQFETMVSLFLYLKHGLSLPSQIIGAEADRLPVLAYYLWAQEKKSKIFGFTGTASSVAGRIRGIYQMETTLIPSHYETQRRLVRERLANLEAKKNRLEEILKGSSKNTLVVVEAAKEAEELIEVIKNEKEISYRLLSAANKDEDFELYQWVSKREEDKKRRVLICVKMIGRGVDLKPDEFVRKDGFLLISTTSFKYRRSFQQLMGRVGRRGERGEVYILISPQDEVFSYLSEKEKRPLKRWFEEKNNKKIDQALDKAWDYWEKEITEKMRRGGYFSLPIERLRNWIEGDISLAFFEKKLADHSLNIPEFKSFLKGHWPEILAYLENTFNAWSAPGKFGPFGEGEPQAVWTNFVFEKTLRLFFNFINPLF